MATEILGYPLNTASFGGGYYSATDAQTYTCTRTTGVYSSETDLRVLAVGGRDVTVTEGLGWLNFGKFRGIAIANTVEKNGVVTFNITPSITLPRIDRVVACYNYNDDKVEILLRQGTPTSTPEAPQLRRDGSYYEIALADVMVYVGSGNITQGNITDQRLNEDLCGIMRDGVTGIPTQQLHDEFTSWFNNFKTINQSDFDYWFEALQQELEDFDPAAIIAELADLQIKVNQNMQNISVNTQNISTLSSWRKLVESNGNAKILTDYNVDNAVGSGFYYYTVSHFNKAENTTSGLLRVIKTPLNYVFQEMSDQNQSVWTRHRNDAGVWSAWQKKPSAFRLSEVATWTSVPLSFGWFAGYGGVRYYVDNNYIVHVLIDIYKDAPDALAYYDFAYLPSEIRPQKAVSFMLFSETKHAFCASGQGALQIIDEPRGTLLNYNVYYGYTFWKI